MFSGYPIKQAIVNNLLKTETTEENGKIIINDKFLNLILSNKNNCDNEFYKNLTNALIINLDVKKINETLEIKNKKEKYHNYETKINIISIFNSYGLSFDSLKKMLKHDDTIGSILKNKTANVLFKIRNNFNLSSIGINP